jgi:hypothetical protein
MVCSALRMADSIDGKISSPFSNTSKRFPARMGGPSSTPMARPNCGSAASYRRAIGSSIRFSAPRAPSTMNPTASARPTPIVVRRMWEIFVVPPCSITSGRDHQNMRPVCVAVYAASRCRHDPMHHVRHASHVPTSTLTCHAFGPSRSTVPTRPRRTGVQNRMRAGSSGDRITVGVIVVFQCLLGTHDERCCEERDRR